MAAAVPDLSLIGSRASDTSEPEQIRDTTGTPSPACRKGVLATTRGSPPRMSPEFSSEGRLPPCVVVAAHLDGLSGGKAVAYDRSRPGQGRRVSARSDWCGAARGGQPVSDGVPVDAQL